MLHSEHRLRKIEIVRRFLVELDKRRERIMSTEEQEKSGAAEDDYRQSQIYTATEDTLFTKTTLTLSGAHSLVSMSLEYLPSEIEN